MKRAGLIAIAAGSAALAGCTQTYADPPPIPPAPSRIAAELRDSTGRVVATATAMQVGDGLRVQLDGTSITPGAHGAHVHTTGRCDPPDFASAGPHWNPTNATHGKDNPAGMHKGDLPNLLVGTDGRGSIEITVPGASISGGPNAMMDSDGAAIVVHAQADDHRTDPSGNSGGRIACGVFR